MMAEVRKEVLYRYKRAYGNYRGGKNSTVKQENVDFAVKDEVCEEDDEFDTK